MAVEVLYQYFDNKIRLELGLGLEFELELELELRLGLVHELILPYVIIGKIQMLPVLIGKLMKAFAILSSKGVKELPLVTHRRHSTAELLDGYFYCYHGCYHTFENLVLGTVVYYHIILYS